MSRLGLALLLALGLCLGVASQAGDSWGATAHHKKTAVARGKQCRYTCPRGLFVCPDDEPGPNGCYHYRCTKGRIGSASCP
jgi:hypothetical protein